jgi:hypothetical protein
MAKVIRLDPGGGFVVKQSELTIEQKTAGEKAWK